MQVLHKDMKEGEIKLAPDNLDDIWHLHNIIQPGDLVRMVTFRTDDQSKDDQKRSKKVEKKRMKLGIRVEKTGFHEFSDRLRIHVTIEEGPQELGAYHTLNVYADPTNKLSIVKEKWPAHDLERIEEAVKRRHQPLVVFVSLDDDQATIAVLRQSGLQWIADVSSELSGKMYADDSKGKEYFGDILSLIKQNTTDDSPVVVVGPGFTREHFLAYGKEHAPGLFGSCVTCGTGHAEMNGVHEAIKIGVVDQITKHHRVSMETQLIDKLFNEIHKNGLATYGAEEVKQALKQGAVEHVLIADTIIRTSKGEKLLDQARNMHSEFTIINTMHDAGKTFLGIGGIAALLRYKI